MSGFELPQDFVLRMKDMLGSEYDEFEKAFTQGEEHCGLRVNTLKTGAREKISAKLGGFDEIPWCTDGCYTNKNILSGKHAYHAAGLFYFQEPSAMAVVPAANIESGAWVLDLCAAPGGKSTQAAAALRGTGLLVANEIIPSRAKILSENIERMGIKNAVVTNESPDKLRKKFPEMFDCIILDAPCSGEGMFRKEPQAVTEWSAAHSDTCAVRQKHIADCAVGMLAPGGRLIYSTCTFAPAENEGVAEYITENYPQMRLLPIEANGLSEGYDELSLTRRIFPHKAKGEGHFFALFEKAGEKTGRSTAQAKSVTSAEYADFCKRFLKNEPQGIVISFGDRLYLMPASLDMSKLKVLRAGLELGEVRKGRFVPSHALALALDADDFVNSVSFDAESDEIAKYLHGETIPSEVEGWCAVLADGFPIGWAKGSNGVLKNHYPKHLRM